MMQHENNLPAKMQQRKGSALLISTVTAFLLSTSLLLSNCTAAGSLNSTNASGTPASGATTSKPTAIVTPSSPPATPTTPTTSKLPTIISLHMIDATMGWAFTRPNLYSIGGYILRTTDGGQHWKNVSPPYPTGQQYDGGAATEFLTSSIAWVVTARHRVYHTIDGGQTWQERLLIPPNEGSFATNITFINPEDGWIVYTNSTNNGAELTIFRTTNGGNSWTAIAHTGNSATQLPYGSQDWIIGFHDATTGWASGGYSCLTCPVLLYITHDGGVSWQRQSLPLPPGEAALDLSPLPPTFFTASDGLLPILFYATGNYQGLDLYVTHNGGKSWSSTKELATYVPQGNGASSALKAMSLLDMNNAWVTGNNANSLYTTQDGGQHWQTISTLAQSGIEAISFVSPLTGWALVPLTFNTSSLYRTTDGGKTWTEIFRVSS